MNNRDELINKYIDNEINQEELNEINELIKTEDKFSTLFSVHKYVHETLYQMPLKKAPFSITEAVMSKISSKLSEKYRKNYYFRFVIASLGSILFITLFLFFYFIGDLALFNDAAELTSRYSDKILTPFSYLMDIFNSNIFKTVSGLLGFIILIIFYFNYNTHKQLKDTLKNL
jgi:hypothetical protein